MVHSCDIAWNTTKVHAALTEVHFTPGSKPSLFSPQWGPFFHNSTRSLFKKCRNGKTEFARVYLFFAALLSSAAAAKPLAPRRGPDSSADGPLFVWLCHVKLKAETRWRKRWEKSLNPIEGPTCSVSKHLGRCLDWNERSSSLTPLLEDQLGGNIWIFEIPEGTRPNFAFFGHVGSSQMNLPRGADASVDEVRCQEQWRVKDARMLRMQKH